MVGDRNHFEHGPFYPSNTPAKRCVSGDDCGVLQDEALSAAEVKQNEVLISAVLTVRQIERVKEKCMVCSTKGIVSVSFVQPRLSRGPLDHD